MNPRRRASSSPDGKNLVFTFILVSSLFLLWGFCNGMIDVMDKHFQEELGLTKSQSAWVQFAHYLGYFLMSMPGRLAGEQAGLQGRHHRRAADGGAGRILVHPGHADQRAWCTQGRVSANTAFVAFLAGVCIIATGLTFLETIANPYTTVLGDQRYAATRINLAQSCNGIGWIFGPIVGSMFFYSKDAAGKSTGSQTLYIPYVGVAVGGARAGGRSSTSPTCPTSRREDDYHLDDAGAGRSHSIWSHPHFVLAVAAQFFYVAAQAGIFSFFINYMTAEVPAIPRLVECGHEQPRGQPACCSDWLQGWFETSAAACWRSATRARRTWRRSDSCASWWAASPAPGCCRSIRAHKVLGLYGAAERADRTFLVFLKLGLALGGVRVPELLLHVDHVPDHLRAGHLRPGRARQEGVGLHRDGDHGRCDPAQTDGLRRRRVRHVARLHRADGLLRVRGVLRLQLAAAAGGPGRVEPRKAGRAPDGRRPGGIADPAAGAGAPLAALRLRSGPC